MTLIIFNLVSAWPKASYFKSSHPFNNQCPPITSVRKHTSLRTSVKASTITAVSTQIVITTVSREQTVPTTLLQTVITTLAEVATSVVQSTTTVFGNVLVTQTVQGSSRQQTRFVTTTRVVPQVSFLTHTQIRTEVVPAKVTLTQIQTNRQPLTNIFTQTTIETRAFTVTGPDVVRTRVQTLLQTSIVRLDQPDVTRFVTSTAVQQQVQTTVLRGQDILITSLVQSQQIIPITAFTTVVETVTVTQKVIVTNTNIVKQTQIQTQFVKQEQVTTQLVPTTVFSIVVLTQFQLSTQVQSLTQTQFITVGGGVQTQEVTHTSIVQVPDQDTVVTTEVLSTQTQQQTVLETITRPRNVFVTTIISWSCVFFNKGYY